MNQISRKRKNLLTKTIGRKKTVLQLEKETYLTQQQLKKESTSKTK